MFTPIHTTQATEIDAISKIFSYAVSEDPQSQIDGLHLYKISTDGAATLLEENIFPDGGPNTFDASGIGIDNIEGKIYFREPPRGDGSNVLRVRVFDVKTETITGWKEISGLGDGASPIFVPKPDLSSEKIEKKCTSSDGSTCAANDAKSISLGGSDMDVVIDTEGVNIDGEAVFTKNTDGSIQIGADGNDIDITAEGLSIDGNPMITKKADGNIHIGKNSLITPEDHSTLSDGRKVHHLWAEDDSNNKIPLNIYGSDLLIDGKSVQGQIDENKSNINNLGSGVASSTALTAALTALPQTAKESKLSCGVGTGAYSSKYAVGFGCASKVNKRIDVNAGGSYVFGGSKSYGAGTLDSGVIKAGFVFKLGELKNPTLISMKEKEKMKGKISSLEEKNEKINSKNQKLENTVSTLMARLERLEKVALGESKSKDLATIKLP